MVPAKPLARCAIGPDRGGRDRRVAASPSGLKENRHMAHPNTEGRAEADRATRRNGSAVLAAMLLAAPAIASAQTAPPAAPAQAAPAQAAPAPQAAPQA